MQFWVYILRCRDGSCYTGHTDDLDKRMWEHREGKGADWTRRRRPVELVWCDWAGTRYEALAFERRVKNWSAAKKEALIAGDWARVRYLARPPHERPPLSRLAEGGVRGPARTHDGRPSTSAEWPKPVLSDAAGGVEGLGTNENSVPHGQQPVGRKSDSFVPSEVEGRTTEVNAALPSRPREGSR